jgi:DNA anti-recombination protein RmuC
MQQTNPHITLETNVMFDEFMDETASLDVVSTHPKISSVVSPSSLLQVLNEAKVLISSLQSNNQVDHQSDAIISRLTHLESELSDLKELISKANE